MQNWFGLREEHRDFKIETDSHSDLFFAHRELRDDLDARLRRSFRTGNPPKMVLHGDWGVGKTHTMRHMEHKIVNDPDFGAHVAFAELPDITAKSTFQVAHGAMLDALSKDTAKAWAMKFFANNGDDARKRILEFTQSGEITGAISNLVIGGDALRISWDWLRGMGLSAADARFADLSPALVQSAQLVRVLQLLGELCREATGKLLVFMLDEVTKLDYVTNPDSSNHWLNAFKTLADQQTREVGFVVSCSFPTPEEMPPALQDAQVVTRFGDSNYIPISRLDEPEAVDFIKHLVNAWIDPEARDRLLSEYEGQTDGEAIGPDSFPFTEPALGLVAAYACRINMNTTPRDIQQALDDLLNRAIDRDRHIVSAAFLNPLIST